jgi:hypothetical protein
MKINTVMKPQVNKSFHNISPEERTPIVEQCLTAALEVINDPNSNEKDKDKIKKITINIPCKRIDGDPKAILAEGEEAPVLYCTAYMSPAAKWRTYSCPFAQKITTNDQERMLNPLKASKRAAGK